MSKEDIEHFDCPGCGWLISIPDYAEEYINQEKKKEAIEFFKFNAKNIAEYLHYLRKADSALGTSEYEEQMNWYEGTSLENRYELYQQSKQIEK